MLKEETLEEINQREYEEPDGEFLEMIGQGSNTITVLTRVNSDKGAGIPEPFDPTELTVSAIKDALEAPDEEWSNNHLAQMVELEENGKNRTTAIAAIEEQKQ